jgi:hypothetical protein
MELESSPKGNRQKYFFNMVFIAGGKSMKKAGLVILAAFLMVAWTLPNAVAAEQKAPPKVEKKASTPQPKVEPAKKTAAAKADQVTQCELAQLLVKVLALARFLPPAPSCQECFAILLANGVSPADGWVTDKVVTKADLARVIVESMKKQGDVQNPDDPASYIDYLRGQGIPIDTVGQSVEPVPPLPEPIAPNVLSSTTDPLPKPHVFNPLDETQYGTDMATIARLISELEFAPPTPAPAPAPKPAKPAPSPTPNPRPFPVTRD